MKITMPLVTLLSGAAVGVAVLIASTLSTPATPSFRNQAATAPAPTPTVIVTLPPASSATVVILPPPASSASAAAPTTASSASAAAPTTASSATVVTLPPPAWSAPAAAPTTAAATAPAPAVRPTAPASSPYSGWPANADYAGQADGGAWVTISVRGRQAIAYVRTGYGQARLNGTAIAGVLSLTGQNDTRLDADYDAARAVGYVIADGIRYAFSASAVHGTAASSQ
jgi:hypothetical protein